MKIQDFLHPPSKSWQILKLLNRGTTSVGIVTATKQQTVVFGNMRGMFRAWLDIPDLIEALNDLFNCLNKIRQFSIDM